MTSSRLSIAASPLVVVAMLLPLALTGCGTARVVSTPSRSPGHSPANTRPVHVSTPKSGATAVVHRGDTLYRIATRNGVSVLDLAMWNNVSPPYTIYPGQQLRLYPSQRAGRPQSVAPAATSTQPRAAVQTAPTTVATQPVVVPSASPFAWSWPADGTIASRYVSGEPTSQGIDIAGQAGQPIRAAADGVVVYSGSGLVGYGELIIVKHNDAWLSAYGHNRARLVNEGQLVKAGQQIAEMGHSGAERDMLHFEIRFNGKPVDPLGYLPRSAQR